MKLVLITAALFFGVAVALSMMHKEDYAKVFSKRVKTLTAIALVILACTFTAAMWMSYQQIKLF